nr:hypothetical protein Iba_chr06bCG13060 [Ipomoea batatas]
MDIVAMKWHGVCGDYPGYALSHHLFLSQSPTLREFGFCKRSALVMGVIEAITSTFPNFLPKQVQVTKAVTNKANENDKDINTLALSGEPLYIAYPTQSRGELENAEHRRTAELEQMRRSVFHHGGEVDPEAESGGGRRFLLRVGTGRVQLRLSLALPPGGRATGNAGREEDGRVLMLISKGRVGRRVKDPTWWAVGWMSRARERLARAEAQRARTAEAMAVRRGMDWADERSTVVGLGGVARQWDCQRWRAGPESGGRASASSQGGGRRFVSKE